MGGRDRENIHGQGGEADDDGCDALNVQIQALNNGSNEVYRFDNVVVTAVPEVASVLPLASLLGCGFFFRMRKRC